MAANYYRQMMMLPRAAGQVAPPATGFITTWMVTNGGSITLPLRSGSTYNMSVDYGDGTVVNVNSNNDPDATHQYTSGDSNRTVQITGTMGAWYFNNVGSKANFRGVSLWGPIDGASAYGLEGAFYGCTAATFPNYTNGLTSSWAQLTEISTTWRDCSSVKNGFPDISVATNVIVFIATWRGCSGNTNYFPAVSNATKAITVAQAWFNCSGIKNGFPNISALTKLNNFSYAWYGCSGNTNSIQGVLGDCSWITGQVKNVANAFDGCVRMTGNGMPLVTAITNSPGYPTGYTITDCLQNCTNLTDWADIPAAFK
jgi:hypothetical protein